MIYSPLDALKLARQNPDREIVFFAIGFETTAPSTALTLLRAQADRIENFFAPGSRNAARRRERPARSAA